MVIPALAITGASLDVRSEEGDDLLGGLDLFDQVSAYRQTYTGKYR